MNTIIALFSVFDYPGVNLIQYLSGTIYVGLIFFQQCVLPKGSLQSTPYNNRYRIAVSTVFLLFVLSILFRYPQGGGFSQPIGQVWMFQFIILFLFFMMRLMIKNRITLRWSYLTLGVCLLAAMAVTKEAYRFPAIMAEFLQLLSASILLGSLIAMVLLLPLKKRPEGKLFLRGLLHLFFPWGIGAVILFAASGLLKIL